MSESADSVSKSILLKLQKSTKLFNGLSFEEIQWILERGKPIALSRSSVILKEGTKSDVFYIILKGEVIVYESTSEWPYSVRKKKVIGRRREGNIIGEIGAVLNIPRTADVECSTDCVLLKHSSRFLREIESSKPDLAIKLYRNIIVTLTDKYISHEKIL